LHRKSAKENPAFDRRGFCFPGTFNVPQLITKIGARANSREVVRFDFRAKAGFVTLGFGFADCEACLLCPAEFLPCGISLLVLHTSQSPKAFFGFQPNTLSRLCDVEESFCL
jgi:hypothetical protein